MSTRDSGRPGEVGFRKTGAIWEVSDEARVEIVSAACDALEQCYGRPRLGNPEDPLDDLMYIMISNRTLPEMAQTIYEHMKNTYADWDVLLDAPEEELYSILKPAGLAGVKAQQIRGAVWRVKEDRGGYTLRGLRQMPESDAQKYLVSLPGVSEKVAKCVMMYTLGAAVLPVDTHVHRIARRLGWTARKRADQCHAELEALVPPARRYAFHVDCIAHGRSVCRPRVPECGRCCISHCCEYQESVNQSDQGTPPDRD